MNADKEFKLQTSQDRAIDVSVFKRIAYGDSYAAMSRFAQERKDEQNDQIWLLEHPPVYTQGTACDLGAFMPSQIPTVKTDRGGQITYHGPGQIVMYPLLNLRQHDVGVKSLVAKLEQCMIDVLSELGIQSDRRDDAPGVYVGGAKIGALGLRIRKGTSYHGLSLNVDMDLSPFRNIDPCGYQGLQVTQVANHIENPVLADIGDKLLRKFVASL
jgi:lipoyl(octanoyl) transferase